MRFGQLAAKYAKLYYISIKLKSDDVNKFGENRLLREISDMYLDKKLVWHGQKFEDTPPRLTDAELKNIPGAFEAVKDLESIRFEVLLRDGLKAVIKADETKMWSSQGDGIAEEFQELKEKHNKLFASSASSVWKLHCPAAADAAADNEVQEETDKVSELPEGSSAEKSYVTYTSFEDAKKKTSRSPIIMLLRFRGSTLSCLKMAKYFCTQRVPRKTFRN